MAERASALPRIAGPLHGRSHLAGLALLVLLPLTVLAVDEFAADLGIKTMVENHGYFCQDSERVEKLMNAVNHPNFGALVDMGNFLCADEDPARAVGRMAPYAFHCHAKDFHVKVLNLAAFEDGFADGLHAGLDLGEGQDGDLCGKAGSQHRNEDGDESH